MKAKTPQLHIGVVEFSEPTLLLVSDVGGFQWLADQLESRRDFTTGQAGDARSSQTTIHFAPTSVGRLRRDRDAFTWEVSHTESQQFAEQLRALSVSKVPAHAYLDASDGMAAIASLGEYDPEKIFSR